MFVLLFRSKNKRSARIDDLIWNCFFPKPVNYSWFVFLYWSEKTVFFFIWLFRHIRGHKVFVDDLVSSYLFTFVFSDAHFSVSKTGFSSRWSAPRVVFRIWCSCFTNKNKNDPVKTKNKEEKEIITLKVNSWKMKQVLEVILGKLHSSQIVCPAESFFSPVTSQTEERKSFRSDSDDKEFCVILLSGFCGCVFRSALTRLTSVQHRFTSWCFHTTDVVSSSPEVAACRWCFITLTFSSRLNQHYATLYILRSENFIWYTGANNYFKCYIFVWMFFIMT